MGSTDIAPPVTTPPPGPTDAEVRDAELAARRRLRGRRGQAATILTGPSGDFTDPQTPARGTLLGGGR